MSIDPRSLKNMLSWVIGGSQGGYIRFLILQILHDSPSNANQLAKLLEKDYTTIRHHLRVLEDNKMVIAVGKDYAKSYVLASFIEDNYRLLEDISKAALSKSNKLRNRFFDGNKICQYLKFVLVKNRKSIWSFHFPGYMGKFVNKMVTVKPAFQ